MSKHWNGESVSWDCISIENESKYPMIYLEDGKRLEFHDFEDYRSFVMTLVGIISASDVLPYKIQLVKK